MNLKERILNDFVNQMKNKNVIAKNILGSIKTEISLQEKVKELNDNDVLVIIQKELKKLESTIQFEGIKDELKNEAILQKEILMQYIPAQMSAEDVFKEIDSAVTSGKIEKNMGAIMKYAKENFQGKIDMKELSLMMKGYL